VSVRVERLSKQFAGAAAVSEVSFAAPSGAITTLLGPSGSGKTTLLRLIAGLEVPDAGRVFLDGRECTRVPVQKREVGFVFQGHALFEHLTVHENVAFGLRVRRLPAREVGERVDELLELVQLRDHGRRQPAQLSGGQRQRVAMGRAIVREPKAFLMDEPLSNLDAKLRVQMRAEIARIQQALKVTTLYVTHDQVEAMTMGHRVAVMRDGVLQQVDKPQRLYDAPANLFVASFVGSPPMNLFEATVEGVGTRLSFGDTTVEHLRSSAARQGLSLWEALRSNDPELPANAREDGGRRRPEQRDVAGERDRHMRGRRRRRPARGRSRQLEQRPGRRSDREDCESDSQSIHQPGTVSPSFSSAIGAPKAISVIPSEPASRLRITPGPMRRMSHWRSSSISSSSLIRPEPSAIT